MGRKSHTWAPLRCPWSYLLIIWIKKMSFLNHSLQAFLLKIQKVPFKNSILLPSSCGSVLKTSLLPCLHSKPKFQIYNMHENSKESYNILFRIESFYSDLEIMRFSLNNGKEASLPVKPLLKTQNHSLARIFCNTFIKLFLFWQYKPLHSSSLLKTLEVSSAWVFTFVILSEIFAAVLKTSHSPSFYTLASFEFFIRLQDNTPSTSFCWRLFAEDPEATKVLILPEDFMVSFSQVAYRPYPCWRLWRCPWKIYFPIPPEDLLYVCP